MIARLELTQLKWRIFLFIFVVAAFALGIQVLIGIAKNNGVDYSKSPTFLGSVYFAALAIAQAIRQKVSRVLEQLGMLGVLLLITIQFSIFVSDIYEGQRSADEFTEIVPWLGVAYTASFIVFPLKRALFASISLLLFIFSYWSWYVFRVEVPGQPNFALESLVDTTMSGVVIILLLVFFKRVTDAGARAETKASLMEELAHTDSLTGLYNRRYFDQILFKEFQRFERYDHPLSVALCDIDSFKQINDTLTHTVGDEVLKVLADILQANTRDLDVVARYGGEEFAIAFLETPRSLAVVACEKIRQAIEVYDWKTVHPDLNVTASFGVADSLHMQSPTTMVDNADIKLYEAKHLGKNQVCA